MTGLWNRRKFEEQLTHYANIVERYPDTPTTCLALFDIDHFKRINDERGHDEGDKVICSVAETLLREVRTTDFVSRVGGEEFAVIMPHTTVKEAEVVLNRLRVAVQLRSNMTVTVSAGYSDLTADRTRSYKCADIALYESKALVETAFLCVIALMILLSSHERENRLYQKKKSGYTRFFRQ